MSDSFRAMLLSERENTPGVRDLLAAPCSAAMYRVLGVDGYHPSFSDNLREVEACSVDVPDSRINGAVCTAIGVEIFD